MGATSTRNVVVLGQSALSLATRRLVAAMVVPPSVARVSVIRTAIAGLMTGGLWPKLDVFYIDAAHDTQAGKLNWKTPSRFPLVPTGSPTFTIDRGDQGDAVGAYLISSYIPSSFNGNYQLNSAVAGVWLHLASTINSSLELSLGNGRIQRSSSGTTEQYRINDAASANMGAGAPTTGHYAVRRTSSAERSSWLNGVSVANDTQASTSIATTFVLLSSSAANFSNARVSAAYAGGGFTDTDMATMHTVLTAYMTAVGVV